MLGGCSGPRAAGSQRACGAMLPCSRGEGSVGSTPCVRGEPWLIGVGSVPPRSPNPSLHQDAPSSKSKPHAPSPRLQAARDAAQMHPAVQTAPRGIFFPLPKDCSTGARMCKHCKVSSDSSRHSGALSARKLLCCRYIK